MSLEVQMNKVLIISVVSLLLLTSFAYVNYSIPQLIPNDYNCAEHPGIISDSNPRPFESGQHYTDRKDKAIQQQIKEACD